MIALHTGRRALIFATLVALIATIAPPLASPARAAIVPPFPGTVRSVENTTTYLFGSPAYNVISPLGVNLATGSFTISATDLAHPGRTLPLAFARTYNELDYADGPLGVGWTHTFNWSLDTSAYATSLGVRRGDGWRETFTFTAGDGQYHAPSATGVFDTVVRNADGTFTYRHTNQVTRNFTSAGRMTGIQDAPGNRITLSYTGSNLTGITDAVGRRLVLVYDGSHLVRIDDPIGRSVSYGYDGGGRLNRVFGRSGAQTLYTYSGTTQRIATVTDPDGRRVVSNVFNADGQVTQQTEQDGQVTSYAYGPTAPAANATATLTDPRGTASSWSFDTRGRVTAQTVATLTQTAAYDTAGDRTSYTDRRGATTAWAYDSKGNLTTETLPAVGGVSAVTTHQHDTKNNRVRTTSPSGLITTNSYDALSNVLLSTAVQLDATTTATTSYAYTDAADPGMPTQVTSPRGGITTMRYDAHGNLIETIDAEGNKTTSTYDAVGRMLTTTDPDGYAAGATASQHTWTTAYNRADDVIKQTDPMGYAATSAYDYSGNLRTSTTKTGNVTWYGYDGRSQPVRLRQDSAAATPPVPAAAAAPIWTSTTYDETDPFVTISGSSNLNTGMSSFKGTLTQLTATGSYAQVTVSNAWLVELGAWSRNDAAILDVKIDGAHYSYIDQWSDPTALNVTWQVPLPDQGSHTVQFLNTGTANAQSQSYNRNGYVDWVSVVAAPELQSTKYDDADPIITMSGSYLNTGMSSYQGTLTQLVGAGSYAQIIVSRALRVELGAWKRNDAAILDVKVDGVHQSYIDQWADPGIVNVTWQIPLPDQGSHVVQFLNTGTANPATQSYMRNGYVDWISVIGPLFPVPAGSDEKWDDIDARLTYVGSGWVHASQGTPYYQGTVSYNSAWASGSHVNKISTMVQGVLSFTITALCDHSAGKTQVSVDGTLATTLNWAPAGGTCGAGVLESPPIALANTGQHQILIDLLNETSGDNSFFYFDAFTLKGSVAATEPALTSTSLVTTTTRDANGNATRVVQPNAVQTDYAFDALDRTTSMTTHPDTLAQITAFSYDAGGNPLTRTTPDGVVVTNTYDARNHLTGRSSTGLSQSFAYDSSGLRTSATEGGTTWTYEYDRAGRMTLAAGPDRTLSYTYDRDANRTAIGYQAQSNPKYDETDPFVSFSGATNLNTGMSSYQGTLTQLLAAGAYAQVTVSNAVSVELGGWTRSDAAILDVTIDGVHSSYIDQWSDPAVTYVTWQIPLPDSGTHTVRLTDTGNANPLTQSYMRNNYIDWITVIRPAQAVTYAYGLAGRLTTVTDWAGRVSTYTYKPSGRVKDLTLPNGMKTTYTWNNAGALVYLGNAVGATTITSHQYSVDADGRRTSINEFVQGITAPGDLEATSYAYDGLGRLTSAAGTHSESFTLDGASNITSRSGPAATYAIDGANRPTGDGTAPIVWTAADRLASRAGGSFSYDALDRLTTASTTDTATFSYTPDGLLRSRAVGSASKTYVWDPTTSPQRLLAAGTDRIVYGLGPLYIVRSDATTRTLARDGQKSVRAELNDAAAVTGSYRYASYGALEATSGAGPSVLAYTGQLRDPSGLYYLRARWYDPVTARFLTRDPLGDGFGYAGGDPISASDPSGMGEIADKEGGCGAVCDDTSPSSGGGCPYGCGDRPNPIDIARQIATELATLAEHAMDKLLGYTRDIGKYFDADYVQIQAGRTIRGPFGAVGALTLDAFGNLYLGGSGIAAQRGVQTSVVVGDIGYLKASQ